MKGTRALHKLAGRGPFTFTDLIKKIFEISPNISNIAIYTIRDCLHFDHWLKILTYPKVFVNIYTWLILPYLTTICVRPLLVWIIRSIIVLILSALGIVYNESLYSIELLKQFSELVLDIFTSFFPSVLDSTLDSQNNPLPATSTHELDDVRDGLGFLSVLGIIFIGVLTSLAIITVADYYNHDLISSIPVVNTIADCIHVGYQYTSSYISSWFSSSGDPSGGEGFINPEAISRSSSGSSTASNSTVRGPSIILEDHRTDRLYPVTPPRTPTPTPTPTPEFINNWE